MKARIDRACRSAAFPVTVLVLLGGLLAWAITDRPWTQLALAVLASLAAITVVEASRWLLVDRGGMRTTHFSQGVVALSWLWALAWACIYGRWIIAGIVAAMLLVLTAWTLRPEHTRWRP